MARADSVCSCNTANMPLRPVQVGTLGTQVAVVLRKSVVRERLDKDALAKKAGISRSQLDRLLQGVRPLTADQIDILARAVGSTASQVLAAAENAAPDRPADYRTYPRPVNNQLAQGV